MAQCFGAGGSSGLYIRVVSQGYHGLGLGFRFLRDEGLGIRAKG